MTNKIDQQYQDAKELYTFLLDHAEVTYASYVDDIFKKVLVLSAASFFESQITQAVLNFAKEVAGSDDRVAIFIEKKAISRQYHTFFQWDRPNSNSFWGLFGDSTKTKVRAHLDQSEELGKAEKDFMTLGQLRNNMVHNNFSEFSVNQTVDDIYNLYVSALKFVLFVPTVLTSGFMKK